HLLLAALDLLPEPHLLLGVQKVDAADLAEVEADRILGAEAFLGPLLLLFLGSTALILVRRPPRQVVLGLAGGRQVQPVEDLLHLLRRDEFTGGLVQSLLRLGLSNSGHGHRGGTITCATTLKHRSPSLCPLWLPGNPLHPVTRHYETDEAPGKFPSPHLFWFLPPSLMGRSTTI